MPLQAAWLSLYLPFEILLFQKNFFPLDVFLQTLSLKLFSDAHFFLRHCTPEDFFKMLHISSHAISNVFCHWSALTFLREMAIRGCKKCKKITATLERNSSSRLTEWKLSKIDVVVVSQKSSHSTRKYLFFPTLTRVRLLGKMCFPGTRISSMFAALTWLM